MLQHVKIVVWHKGIISLCPPLSDEKWFQIPTWMKRPPPESPLHESLPSSPPGTQGLPWDLGICASSMLTCTDLGWNGLETAKLFWALLRVKNRNLKHIFSPQWKESKTHIKLLQASRGNPIVFEVALNCEVIWIEAGGVSPTNHSGTFPNNIFNQVGHPQLLPEGLLPECSRYFGNSIFLVSVT